MQELNEAEMFRAVLNEMLEEMKQVHRTIKEMNGVLVLQQQKIDGFQRLLENIQVVAPPPDMQPLKDQFAAGVVEFKMQVKETLAGMQAVYGQQLQKVTEVLEAQPKPIVRRISLFPENDRHGNFKYFFKCLFLSTLGFGLLAGLYAFGVEWLAQRGSRQVPVQERSTSFSVEQPAASGGVASLRRVPKKGRRHRAGDSAVSASLTISDTPISATFDSVR